MGMIGDNSLLPLPRFLAISLHLLYLRFFPAMLMDHVEKLKQQYTDKYVAVDASRPELRRFNGLTGYVRTVNMSGRALVEFDSYANNIGWYDIDIDFLTLVDKPKEEESAPAKKAPAKSKAEAKKPAGKSGKASAPTSVADVLAAARSGGGKPAAPKEKTAAAPKSGAAMSVADVLAAARGEGGKPEAPKKTTAPKKTGAAMSVADVLAAARGEGASGTESSETPSDESGESVAQLLESARQPRSSSGKAPAKSDPAAMSTADILAAARGAAAPAAAPEPAAEAETETETSDPEPEAAAQPAPAGDLPTDTEGIIAWCREHDGS